MFTIQNNGPAIVSTNYFESEHARAGLAYASWNAGELRLLIPTAARDLLGDMQTGHMVVITRGVLNGVDAIEVMFDDGSQAPFSLTVDLRQCDRLIAPTDEQFTVSVWTPQGRFSSWPARYRIGDQLPCLRHWQPTRS